MPRRRSKKKAVAYKLTDNTVLKKVAALDIAILAAIALINIILYHILTQARMGIRDIVHFETEAALSQWQSNVLSIYIIYILFSLISTAIVLFFADEYKNVSSESSAGDAVSANIRESTKKVKVRGIIKIQVSLIIVALIVLVLVTLFGGDGGRVANIGRVIWFHAWRGFIVIPLLHWGLAFYTLDRDLAKWLHRMFRPKNVI